MKTRMPDRKTQVTGVGIAARRTDNLRNGSNLGASSPSPDRGRVLAGAALSCFP
jgi:hypothetical protein